MTEHDRYHYTECGLDNIYLINGFEVLSSPRGDVVQIHNEDGLLEAIGYMLVSEKKWLCGQEVKFLRKELGLTQNDLSAILGMDIQAFARWERGERSRDAAAADRLLRVLYCEHVNGNPRIKESLERLAALDEILGDEAWSAASISFVNNEEDRHHWMQEKEIVPA